MRPLDQPKRFSQTALLETIAICASFPCEPFKGFNADWSQNFWARAVCLIATHQFHQWQQIDGIKRVRATKIWSGRSAPCCSSDGLSRVLRSNQRILGQWVLDLFQDPVASSPAASGTLSLNPICICDGRPVWNKLIWLPAAKHSEQGGQGPRAFVHRRLDLARGLWIGVKRSRRPTAEGQPPRPTAPNDNAADDRLL